MDMDSIIEVIDNAVDNYEAQRKLFEDAANNAKIGAYRAEGAVSAMRGLKEYLLNPDKNKGDEQVASVEDGT